MTDRTVKLNGGVIPPEMYTPTEWQVGDKVTLPSELFTSDVVRTIVALDDDGNAWVKPGGGLMSRVEGGFVARLGSLSRYEETS